MGPSKSLEELDGEHWGDPSFDSHVAQESHRLRKVPLSKLTAENLRFLITQSMSLEYTVPVALTLLEGSIITSGSLYCGDLLSAVAQIEDCFWQRYPELNNRLVEIKIEVETVHETLGEVLVNLEARQFI